MPARHTDQMPDHAQPDIGTALMLALSDPGKITARVGGFGMFGDELESLTHWQARAVREHVLPMVRSAERRAVVQFVSDSADEHERLAGNPLMPSYHRDAAAALRHLADAIRTNPEEAA